MLERGVIDGAPTFPDGWIEAATTNQTSGVTSRDGYGYQWWTYNDGSFVAGGLFGQGIFIDPKRDLVIASNASWTSGLGLKGGERARRENFYKTVQAAIDRRAP